VKSTRTIEATLRSLAVAMVLAVLWMGQATAQAGPLPSWHDGASKARILAFVRAVTEPGGKDFVPTGDRIAVFDNDGTLWSEQPMYVQLAFAIDRARSMAALDP
jgi:hypothetical protein